MSDRVRALPAKRGPVEQHIVEPIDFGGTFELAMWCKLLRDRGWVGPAIARSLGRSEGYVNNLIRIVERASLGVLARWKAEQERPGEVSPVCATDWMMRVCVLPHDTQDVALAERIGTMSR